MASPPTERACAEEEPIHTPTRQETVLVYAADPERSAEVVAVVESAGWLPLVARTIADALQILDDAPPDVFVLAVAGTTGEELDLLDHARAGPDSERVPIVCMLDRKQRRLVLDAFGRRADDVVTGHPHPDELIARLRTRIERPPVPRGRLLEDPVTGALTSEAFEEQLRKEHERVHRGGQPGALAFVSFDELPELTEQHGSRGRDELLGQLVRLIKADGRKLDFVGWRRGMLAILLPSTPRKGSQARFERLVRKIYEREFEIAGKPVKLTPVIGYTETVADATLGDYEDRAWDASMFESDQLDLHPTRWVSAMSGKSTSSSRLMRGFERIRTPFQVISQQLAAMVLPFLVYLALGKVGVDITGVVYISIVVALAFTALSIWWESQAAVAPTEPPPAPDGEPPLASAIIAAYLPNEAGTVLETVEAFLQQDYPNLQIILAYNTPRRLEVEDELKAIAARDPRFEPLRVEGSVSKAQNVNAALAHVRGEFVGLFDADHHPGPGSFHRAWRWLAAGAGVVQGHCVIRNGDTNFVTRLVATEFESIYAVSHPGRARVHGFGIFGGSNGYWRTSLLHRTRMRGSMLTEDIDSSMRVVQSGEVIISDPDLVSTELSPDTFGALWNQRLRWAQGWSQVSLRHLIKMMKSAPSLRQKLGVFYLLGWREVYPWISLQIFPLLVYWWYRGEPTVEWFVPIFVFTSILTLSVGPAQSWYAWRLANPEIKKHTRWFVTFFFASMIFYTELKNVIARTAHLKEAMRERKWKVTPRTGSVALDAEDDADDNDANAEIEADDANTEIDADAIEESAEQVVDAPLVETVDVVADETPPIEADAVDAAAEHAPPIEADAVDAAADAPPLAAAPESSDELPVRTTEPERSDATSDPVGRPDVGSPQRPTSARSARRRPPRRRTRRHRTAS